MHSEPHIFVQKSFLGFRVHQSLETDDQTGARSDSRQFQNLSVTMEFCAKLIYSSIVTVFSLQSELINKLYFENM